MELKYSFMILGGAIFAFIILAVFFIYKPGKTKFKKGIKSANSSLFKGDSYYKRKKTTYFILRIVLIASVIGGVMASCLLLARPYHIKKIKEEQYNRDIMICMDVSSSVNALNYKLTKELQNTVRDLNGERVGIVMFNTSPVLVSPLSDDYDFTIEQLQNIRHAIKVTEDILSGITADDYTYWDNFLYSGTLVGNEEKGSSLIAEGLLGAVFNFSQKETKRTKIVIFTTDNENYASDTYDAISLQKAADICKNNNIIVYGIGTKEMNIDDMNEMKFAVESTGGKFYLEEDSGTQKGIIEDIAAQSATKVKGKTIIKEIEDPQFAYSMIILCFLLALVSAILLRRSDAFWIIRQALVVLMLVALLITFIIPTLSARNGKTVNVKVSSDMNVLFVIDDTISMLAQDYNGNNERLTAVKEHCCNIVDELEGAKFSVITFHNSASVMSPFTNNSEHIKNVIEAISPLESFYAKGTTLNTSKDLLLSSLQMISKKSTNNIVFFISDGEITNDEQLESFKDIAQYVNGGAVLGYGTDQGGEMWTQGKYDAEPEQVMDTTVFPYVPAVSRIDEKNLKALASDLGIKYVNMNNPSSLDGTISTLKNEIGLITEVPEENNEGKTEYISPEKYWGWIFAIPILILFVFESGYVIRKR